MTNRQVELHENLLGENKSGGVRHEDAASLEYQALF